MISFDSRAFRHLDTRGFYSHDGKLCAYRKRFVRLGMEQLRSRHHGERNVYNR